MAVRDCASDGVVPVESVGHLKTAKGSCVTTKPIAFLMEPRLPAAVGNRRRASAPRDADVALALLMHPLQPAVEETSKPRVCLVLSQRSECAGGGKLMRVRPPRVTSRAWRS
jgi:hypothetical protein